MTLTLLKQKFIRPSTKDVINAFLEGYYEREYLKTALDFKDEDQEELFKLAQIKRTQFFPSKRVEVRSVIEISNICTQRCLYCSIGGAMQKRNYLLETSLIVKLASYLYEKGRKNILLQSGENKSQSFVDQISQGIEEIKSNHPDMQIILCLGNMSKLQYEQLFRAGATKYILKLETTNEKIFNYCRPNDTPKERLKCMDDLVDIGFELGSGNIIGLPDQSLNDIVDDLLFIHKYPLRMNSTTVFIPGENTVLRNLPKGNITYTLNMMALMRIMNPHRNMPTTSSLEKAIKDGQLKGLLAGANTITIHDGTPEELQEFFPIYSTKRIRPQLEHFSDILTKANLHL